MSSSHLRLSLDALDAGDDKSNAFIIVIVLRLGLLPWVNLPVSKSQDEAAMAGLEGIATSTS